MNLSDESLAKRIAMIQEKYQFPGLLSECEKIMKEYGISKEHMRNHTKETWKLHVKNVIRKSEESKLKDRMKHYKKIHHEKKIEEKYVLKEYMKSLNLKRARMKFALESEMVQQIKFNYMSDKKYEKSNWACDFCLEIKKKIQS